MTLARVTAAALLFALLACGMYAWSNGMRFYALDSGSMSPAIDTGAVVVDLPATPINTLRVGDVVTFHPTPAYTVTHRIAAIGPDGITTKGDANASIDAGYVQPNMIAGRVAFSVPLVGYVLMFFQHPVGVVGLLLLVLILFAVFQFTESSPKLTVTPPIEDER